MNTFTSEKLVQDLKVGDVAVFEASYGPEPVTGIEEMFVGGTVSRDQHGKIIIPPFVPMTSGEPWTMFKLALGGSYGPRYVVRFKHEPVSLPSGDPETSDAA